MPTVLTKPVPNTEAAKFIADKPVVSRQVFDQLLPDIQARAFTITGIEDANLVQSLRDRIAEIPQGADWDKVKTEIVDKVSPWIGDGAEKRAELLLRSHGYQAYSAAQYQVMDRQRAAFPFWQYQTSEDDHVRDSHAALNGIVLPADSPFWATHFPPWDFGCRCQVIPLTAEDAQDMQATDAAKKPEERRVLDGLLQRELETNGTLTRALPGDNGLPRRYDVNRVEREGGYSFDPGSLKMDAAQLSQRYDAEVWKTFESYAKNARLDDGRSVMEWFAANSRTGDLRTNTGLAEANNGATQSPRKAPVSAALEITTKQSVAAQISRTLAVIDQVHDDGALPKVIINAKARSNQNGTFWPTDNRIGISPRGPWPQMTTAHEIGHLLDYQVLGRTGVYASAADPALAVWREAVQNSRAIQMIVESVKGRRPVYNAEYYLRDREIWARSYAQYIAVRSGDVEMLRQLDLIRARPTGQFIQWSDADFAPIAEAIDNLFRSKGWIK